MACLILSLTALSVMWSLYEMPSSFLKHLISVAYNFFRMSTVNVRVSQAINCTERTRESISLIFELREVCLSFQMVFSLAGAAVVRAILDSTSGGLETWSVMTAPRYLYFKLSTLSNFSPLILISMVMPFVLLVISVVLNHLQIYSVDKIVTFFLLSLILLLFFFNSRKLLKALSQEKWQRDTFILI